MPMAWPRMTTLHWALSVSVAMHAALFLFRWAAPERFNRVFQDTPLEVVLVNARSQEPPTQAQAIAQANLSGGGNSDKGRATSPLPPSSLVDTGDSTEDTRRRLTELQQVQQQLLAQLRHDISVLPLPDPSRPAGNPKEREQEERRRQLLRMLAEIEKRVNEENARPRKRYISPATQEAIYAGYYEGLRRKIEERGTRDFPEHRGKRLYGELTMNVTIDAQGQVVEAEVVRSSRNKMLDQRALAIVQASGPFGQFSQEMRKEADQIVVTSRFRFTHDDGLETTLHAPAAR